MKEGDRKRWIYGLTYTVVCLVYNNHNNDITFITGYCVSISISGFFWKVWMTYVGWAVKATVGERGCLVEVAGFRMLFSTEAWLYAIMEVDGVGSSIRLVYASLLSSVIVD